MVKRFIVAPLFVIVTCLYLTGCYATYYPRHPAPLPGVAQPFPAAAPIDLRVDDVRPVVQVTFVNSLKDAKVWLIPENPHSLVDPRLVMEGYGDAFELWLSQDHEYLVIIKVYNYTRFEYSLRYIKYQANSQRTRESIDQGFINRARGCQRFRDEPSILEYKVRHKL